MRLLNIRILELCCVITVSQHCAIFLGPQTAPVNHQLQYQHQPWHQQQNNARLFPLSTTIISSSALCKTWLSRIGKVRMRKTGNKTATINRICDDNFKSINYLILNIPVGTTRTHIFVYILVKAIAPHVLFLPQWHPHSTKND